MTAETLDFLRCPQTLQRLAPASPEVLARVAREPCCDVSGAPVALPLEAALVREDGTVLYPIRGGIPILLIEAGIELR